jgi:hypothetical protein
MVGDTDDRELKRRDFLRRAAVTGAAAAWAAPVIQTVAATPAFAQTQGSPPGDGGCFHSTGTNGGCMPACADLAGCGGNQCGGNNPHTANGPCTSYCAPGQGGGNPCCNPGLCDPANFRCSPDQNGVATYTGSLAGCA